MLQMMHFEFGARFESSVGDSLTGDKGGQLVHDLSSTMLQMMHFEFGARFE
jgi:hypothetical protein